jgi:hypothetical protein
MDELKIEEINGVTGGRAMTLKLEHSDKSRFVVVGPKDRGFTLPVPPPTPSY